jgi:hypothetical protein
MTEKLSEGKPPSLCANFLMLGYGTETVPNLRRRQAKAYRTFSCRTSLSLSVGNLNDKLKRIGHLVVALLSA